MSELSVHTHTKVESLFEEYLRRVDGGEEVNFERFCAAHPAEAGALRELHDLFRQIVEIAPDLAASASAVQDIAARYGEGAVPSVNLSTEQETALPAAIAAWLASRSGSGRYRLEGEVARGGMGAILRVWDQDLRRHLAMKVLLERSPRAKAAGKDSTHLIRFLEEAQVTGQLEHPGIVPVHELGTDAGGRVYFTMKLVKGRDLRRVFELVQRGEEGWTQIRALGVLLKVCEAVSYAHERGVIHRDLKPANVMVGDFGEVYVMDWGLARILARTGSDGPAAADEVRSERQDQMAELADSPLATAVGDVLGTPAYMPPEQARGRVDHVGPHSDVYALGAMLYQLLARRMPYVDPGSDPTTAEIWRAVLAGAPKPLADVAPGAPGELVAICEKAMQRAWRARYADMSELSRDLSAFLEGRVVRAYETGAWAEARKWVRRNRGLAMALAGALVAVLGGLGGIGYVQAEGRRAAEVQQGIADVARRAAEASERVALEEKAKVLRLSDAKRLRELEERARDLWPAVPAMLPQIDSWRQDAEALARNLLQHRATLDELRGSAGPYEPDDAERDRTSHPFAAELARVRAELEGALEALETAVDPRRLEAEEARVLALEARVLELEDAMNTRRTYRMPDTEMQWHHDVLADLVAKLEVFCDPGRGLMGSEQLPVEGWGMAKRAEFAASVEERSVSGADARARWQATIASIRDRAECAAYAGLEIGAQLGLLPIGRDPASLLWEFAHLPSGEPAERNSTGELVLTEETGIVLVLIPGGHKWIGAQPTSLEEPNHDPETRAGEGPPYEVELDPYFLSKYEMTQGQWSRIAGQNPSKRGPHYFSRDWRANGEMATLLHPVESVSRDDCERILVRFALELPTEAQWEVAARAGTTTPFWTGSDVSSLRGAANLADSFAKTHGSEFYARWEADLDDGSTCHAPIGTYCANPYGLHEVIGNVLELCRDPWSEGALPPLRKGDGLHAGSGGPLAVARGGAWSSDAFWSRSAARFQVLAGQSMDVVGVRPARALER